MSTKPNIDPSIDYKEPHAFNDDSFSQSRCKTGFQSKHVMVVNTDIPWDKLSSIIQRFREHNEVVRKIGLRVVGEHQQRLRYDKGSAT